MDGVPSRIVNVEIKQVVWFDYLCPPTGYTYPPYTLVLPLSHQYPDIDFIYIGPDVTLCFQAAVTATPFKVNCGTPFYSIC